MEPGKENLENCIWNSPYLVSRITRYPGGTNLPSQVHHELEFIFVLEGEIVVGLNEHSRPEYCLQYSDSGDLCKREPISGIVFRRYQSGSYLVVPPHTKTLIEIIYDSVLLTILIPRPKVHSKGTI